MWSCNRCEKRNKEHFINKTMTVGMKWKKNNDTVQSGDRKESYVQKVLI